MSDRPKITVKSRIGYDLRCEVSSSSLEQNAAILSMLDNLIEHTRVIKAISGDKKTHGFRISSFTRARDALSGWDKPILSGTQAKRDVKGIGKGVADRIDEFLKTGKLRELDQYRGDTRVRAVMEMTSIIGIGEARAVTLVDKYKLESIEDFMQQYHQGIIDKSRLTAQTIIGVRYYADLQQRIPWNEADQIRQKLESLVQEHDPSLSLTICGSYRRQCTTCGDIDVLVCDPRYEDRESGTGLMRLIRLLTREGFLVGDLTGSSQTKYMGLCRLDSDSPVRRIDIRFLPSSMWAPAILYFTGSGKFNKLMRYRANLRGYTISEYGVWHYKQGAKGEQVRCDQERDIFDLIGCAYLDPTERDF